MKNKPSFKDYVKSLREFDRPFVYKCEKTGKLYKERNSKVFKWISQFLSAAIPIVLYLIDLFNNYTQSELFRLCTYGLIAFIVINLILYPLRYPLIIFEEINSYEDVQKESRNILVFLPYIFFVMGMFYICFYSN